RLLDHRGSGTTLEHPTTGVLLPAPAVAALAGHAVLDDALVTELSGHARAAAVQPTVQDHRPADPRAEVDQDDVGLVLRGAEAPFGPAGGVRVVVHQHRQPSAPHEGVAQRLVAPGEVG